MALGGALKPDVCRECIDVFTKNVSAKEWELFVFSEDIAWCREHREELGFERFAGVTFVEGNLQGKITLICS